jgi:thiol-disulfide isomerase/thioredoxin
MTARRPLTRFALALIVPAALAGLMAVPLARVLGGGRLAAQELHLSGLAGETLDDSDLAHGTFIIVAWASWSPRSRDMVAKVKPLASHWSGRARVVTLDFEEERPAVVAFLAGKDLGVPVFLDADGLFSKKYAIATLPGLLVVKDGKVAYRGKLPDDPDPIITQALH